MFFFTPAEQSAFGCENSLQVMIFGLELIHSGIKEVTSGAFFPPSHLALLIIFPPLRRSTLLWEKEFQIRQPHMGLRACKQIHGSCLHTVTLPPFSETAHLPAFHALQECGMHLSWILHEEE